jgi:hypothetical protein
MERGKGGSNMNETLMLGSNGGFSDMSMNMSMRRADGTII